MTQPDRIHLKRPGYALLGDLLFAALMERYGRHLSATRH